MDLPSLGRSKFAVLPSALPAWIQRRSRSCLDVLTRCCRKPKVETHEMDMSGISEDVDHNRFARDSLSAMAGTCRSQGNSSALVVGMARLAWNRDASQQSTDPVSDDAMNSDFVPAEDDPPAKLEDIIFNIIEPDVVATKASEERVSQLKPFAETSQVSSVWNTLEKTSEDEEWPSQNGRFDDPMTLLEALERDAMCDCLMYSESESSDHSRTEDVPPVA
eukprot:TRINITY_DN10372_c0_g1_i1.p1 TRINITY_DN10372_c0_g1~~TRINITY_DN10372_c0_g1_i1.p1  ORF type:complete len:220 (+),score=28.28 TRINITY_DN10372_c0_g1_i1:68-727(+)